MKKLKAFEQVTFTISETATAVLLLAGTVMALGGCSSVDTRTELAMAPPPFVPSETPVEVYTVLADADYDAAMIEPAAGYTARPPVIERDNSCMQVGVKGGDALSYQWGENRLGLGLGPRLNSDSDRDFGQAIFRYSVSLQKNKISRCTSGNSLWEDVRQSLAD